MSTTTNPIPFSHVRMGDWLAIGQVTRVERFPTGAIRLTTTTGHVVSGGPRKLIEWISA